jgi:thymidylate synthase
MYGIRFFNPNNGLADALRLLVNYGEKEKSRNGEVLAMPQPVILENMAPRARVLFGRPGANPFFHFMEALWMLAGRNDVATVATFNSRMREYSDDGVVFNGAYGYRWREHFEHDQLDWIATLLCRDPTSRHAVLQMYSPDSDQRTTKDVPCNTCIYFRVVDGRLDATICNRSNDVLWGLFGANLVHMTMLLEYMAQRCGLAVGVLRTLTNNLHLYTDILPKEKIDETICRLDSAYEKWEMETKTTADQNTLADLSEGQGGWGVYTPWVYSRDELPLFVDSILSRNVYKYTCPLLSEVALPMLNAWRARRYDVALALHFADTIAAPAWRYACREWLENYAAAKAAKAGAL